MASWAISNAINELDVQNEESQLIEEQQPTRLSKINRLVLVFFFYVVCQRVIFYTATMAVDNAIRGSDGPSIYNNNSTMEVDNAIRGFDVSLTVYNNMSIIHNSTIIPEVLDVKGLFLSACWILSIVGGLAADTLWKNSYILAFGGMAHSLSMVIVIIGSVVVVVHCDALFGLNVVILAVATSACQPTVYVFGAHHFRVRNQEELAFYTSVYYWFTIVGEFIGILLNYLCKQKFIIEYSTDLALGIVSLLLFLCFRSKFRERRTDQTYIFGVGRWLRCKLPTGLTEAESNAVRRNVLVSVPLFAIMVCCMLCVFHLKYVSAVHVALTLYDKDIKMGAMVCDVVIALFIPILWCFIRNNGRVSCPFLRIKLGMVCSIIGLLYAGTMLLLEPCYLAYNLHISATFELCLLTLPQYIFASMAETLLIVTSYEIYWTHSDKKLKATMLGFFAMSWGVSGLIGVFMAWYIRESHKTYLNFGYAVMQLVVLIFYLFYCRMLEADNE